MSTLSDTSAEADQVLTQVYRNLSLGEKWLRVGQAFATGRMLHAAGFRLRHPHATPADIHHDWLVSRLGMSAVHVKGEWTMDQHLAGMGDTRTVIRVLDQLGIAYVVGGSVASSVFGIDRYTRDVDLAVTPFPSQEAQFAASFGPDFYLSLPAIEAAIRDHSSFNIINTASGFKIDLFVMTDSPFDQSVMARRLAMQLPDEPGQPIMVQTPEDVILQKLRRYRLGNETSEQQWKDVLGVMKVQAERLDQGYLNDWATRLGIDDLLARIRQEAGMP